MAKVDAYIVKRWKKSGKKPKAWCQENDISYVSFIIRRKRFEKIAFLKKENACFKEQIDQLKEQLSWFQRQIFGKKSERIVKDVDEKQLYFEGLEASSKAPEEEKKTIKTHRPDAKTVREKLISILQPRP